MREQVAEKLLQVRVSPKFMAILDYILSAEPRTDPEILSMVITSDGGVLAQYPGDVGYNDYIASEMDLWHNLQGVAEVAELTDDEWDWLVERTEALHR